MPFGQGDNGYVSNEPGYEGQIATTRAKTTRTTVSTTTKIPFGRVLVVGSSEGECALPSAAGQRVIGVAIASMIYEQCLDDNDESCYDIARPIKYADDADIYMISENDVDITVSDSVYFRHTASGTPGDSDRLGRVRSDADGGNAGLYPNARFLTSGTAGTPIKVAWYPSPRGEVAPPVIN